MGLASLDDQAAWPLAGPRLAAGQGLGCALKDFFFRFSEISNGHNWGAILSNRDETLAHDTSMIWSIFWGLGAGAWGLGRWEKDKK